MRIPLLRRRLSLIETLSQIGALASIIILGAASASAAPLPDLTRARYLMGTICEITVPAAPEAAANIEAAFSEIGRIESFLSTWTPASELSRLNHAPQDSPVRVSAELAAVLRRTLAWSDRTGGAFNPLVGPLVDVWKTRQDGALPSPELLRTALRRTDLSLITVTGDSVIRTSDVEIEEGGFGKGYAIDRALELLRRRGVSRALVNFGGQIGLYGFDQPIEAAVADPESRLRPAVQLRIRSGSLSTSSGSEKVFQVGGRRFTHLIDPRTGEALPPRGSATVLAGNAFDADVLSTALYVMGPVDGHAWAEKEHVAVLFILPLPDGRYRLISSPAFRDQTTAAPLTTGIVPEPSRKTLER